MREAERVANPFWEGLLAKERRYCVLHIVKDTRLTSSPAGQRKEE